MNLEDMCSEENTDHSKKLTGKNRQGKIVETKVCTYYTGSVVKCRYLGGLNSTITETCRTGFYDSKRFYPRCFKE